METFCFLRNNLIVVLLLWPGLCRCESLLGSEVSSPTAPQCGHWAIMRICELSGVPVEMDALLALLPPKEAGHSLKEIADVLGEIGLPSEGRVADYAELSAWPRPVIAHVTPYHYVVVFKVGDGRVSMFDGSGRRKVWTELEFQNRWTGKVLTVSHDTGDTVLPLAKGRPVKSTPRISFETLIVDKGDISSTGESVEFPFIFRNLGDTDLQITKVKTDCKCVDSSKPDEPITPGEQGSIVLKYKVGSRESEFLHSAYVYTNDPVVPIVRITAAGNAKTTVKVAPEFLNCGRIVSGRTHSKLSYVTNASDVPLEIMKVENTLAEIDVVYNLFAWEGTEKRLVPLSKYTKGHPKKVFVEFSITPRQDCLGRVEGSLYVYTNVEGYERIIIPVNAEIVSPIVFVPDTLFLGEIETGNEIQQSVVAVSVEGTSFKVTSVEIPGSGLVCSYADEESNRVELSFRGKIKDSDKPLGGNIVVRTTSAGNDGEATLVLPLYAVLK